MSTYCICPCVGTISVHCAVVLFAYVANAFELMSIHIQQLNLEPDFLDLLLILHNLTQEHGSWICAAV